MSYPGDHRWREAARTPNLTTSDALAKLVGNEFGILGPCKWLVSSPPTLFTKWEDI